MKSKILLVPVLILLTNYVAGQRFSEMDLELPGVQNGSANWGDYDGDGDFDIHIIGTEFMHLIPLSSLFENRGGYFDEKKDFLFSNGLCDTPAEWVDYDGDGDLDLYLCSDIFRNEGNTFIANDFNFIRASSGSSSFVDYDSDGDLDLFISGSTEEGFRSYLYQNNISSFTKVFQFPGLIYSSSDWNDFNNDGNMDLILTGATENTGDAELICSIYLNDGNSFKLDTTNSFTGVQNGSVQGGDFDNDGDLDLIVTGNKSAETIEPMTKIYISENGTFEESEIELCNVHSSNVQWVDINNDMRLDIILTGADKDYNPVTKLYINNGRGGFDELQHEIENVYNSSIDWIDYDGDGDLDLLISGDNGEKFITKAYLNNYYSTGIEDKEFGNDFDFSLMHDDLIIDDPRICNSLIEIYDINGDVFYSRFNESNLFNFNWSKFPKGFYFLKITNEKTTYVKKIFND